MSLNSLWIEEALAGVFVLSGFGDRTEGVIRVAISAYGGSDFGGLDYMPPNESGEAWLLVGQWTDCLKPKTQQAIVTFRDALARAVELDGAGLELHGSAMILNTSRAFPDEPRGELRELHVYNGGIAVRWWEQPAHRARIEGTFASLPGYRGLHMGAPHWLGYGVDRDGANLRSVTPYIRLDFDEGRGISVHAMAEARMFEPWYEALRAATGWP